MLRRRRYRRWSAEEKRSICRETRAPGVSVAQVARRHALNANLIFKWLEDRRVAAAGAGEEGRDLLLAGPCREEARYNGRADIGRAAVPRLLPRGAYPRRSTV